MHDAGEIIRFATQPVFACDAHKCFRSIRDGEFLRVKWRNGIRTIRTIAGYFGYLLAGRSDKVSLAADTFPTALGFTTGVLNVVACGNPELPNHHVANQRAKFVLGQCRPAVLVTKLDIGREAVRHG